MTSRPDATLPLADWRCARRRAAGGGRSADWAQRGASGARRSAERPLLSSRGRVGEARPGGGRARQGQARRGDQVRDREREPEHQGPRGRHPEFVPQRGAVQHSDRPDAAAHGRQRRDHPQRLPGRRVGRHGAGRHDVQCHEDVPLDGRRAGARSRAHQERARQSRPATCRRASTCSRPSTTRRSRGTTCCGRRATGTASSGASRTGPTVRRVASRSPSGPSARSTSRGRSTSTTTRA